MNRRNKPAMATRIPLEDVSPNTLWNDSEAELKGRRLAKRDSRIRVMQMGRRIDLWTDRQPWWMQLYMLYLTVRSDYWTLHRLQDHGANHG